MLTKEDDVFGWRKNGLFIGDEYDSRLTPGIPATLSKYGFDFADPEPFDQESIARVREWLASASKIRTANAGYYSYGLKHAAEEALGHYVANGDCIAACILSGFVVTQESRTRSSVNAMIGISRPWVKKQIAESTRRELGTRTRSGIVRKGQSSRKKERHDASQ